MLKAANDQLDDEDTADPDIVEQADRSADTGAQAATDVLDEGAAEEDTGPAVDMVSTCTWDDQGDVGNNGGPDCRT